MGASIAVRCEAAGAGWTCRVTVSGSGSSTVHDVGVSAADLARLAPGAGSPEDLVSRSFEFLLVREPKEAILRRFDLPVIGHYFPNWEPAIRQG